MLFDITISGVIRNIFKNPWSHELTIASIA